MNRITPDSIVAAVSLVRKGIVFDLSYDLEEAMRFPECTKGSSRLHSTRWKALRNRMKEILGAIRNGFSSQNLRIGMSDHSGTHIDHLNHVGIKQENGE